MSSDTGITSLLEKAKDQENKFGWLEAAKSYEKAINSGSMSLPIMAETWERIGFCYNLASRRTETVEEFRRQRQMAAEAYENAAKILESKHDQKNEGKIEQCNALARYVRSWLASDSSEKRRMLDECLMFGKRSLEAYKIINDELNYGKMCKELLLCVFERLYVASDWEEMRDFAQDGIGYADRAIAFLSRVGSKTELLEAYYTASLQSWYGANVSEQEEKTKELVKRSLTCADEALKLSKDTDNPYHVAMANWASALSILLFTEKADSAFKHAQEMLKQGTIVKDNYLKGIALYILAFVTNWMTLREADPDKKKEEYRKIIEYAEDGIRYLELVAQDFFIAETYLFYAESYSSLALEAGTSLEERRNELEKAIMIGRQGLNHANRSGSPDAMISTLHALSKALQFCSNVETGKDAKVKLLDEALIHRQEHGKVAEKVFPRNDWVRGVGENYEGLIKLDLARLETNNDKRKARLESAVSDMGEGVSRCKKAILSRPVPTRLVAVGNYENGFGSILGELYLLTKDDKVLNRATTVYEDAANEFKKADLPSRVAECYWRVARSQDCLAQYDKASERFENAFEEYKTAAQRIPHFADFYLDYAAYMKAWSEIERAKFAHDREEYVTAMEHYKKTTDLLKSSKLWSYLSSNFLAWSLLEQAEDSSRRESSAESIEAFTQAAQFFQEAKEALEKEIERVQEVDEKEKAIVLGKASVQRKDYCLARINVERARMYDRKGEYTASAQEYDSAATMFEKMIENTDTELDRKEIKPIAAMCRAWQKMKMADGRASPELYREASELFLKTREHNMRDRAVLLASGNSAFCQALEYGTRFEITRKKGEFSRAKQLLESAANYYSKAGFDGASSWTNATGILFDAYNYMISAELEFDPEKKMRSFLLAEKCLERSAGLYETAGYVGKREEVIRILAKVKEKREFALSLRELLVAPSDASTTRMIPTPSMTVEEPVGLQKFESALVQANLSADQREVSAGESIDLGVHFANLGKNVAFLVRVEGIIPSGLDLIEEPETCRLEDGGLNMKGKPLDPLKTEELRLELRALDNGTFEIKPRIIYIDETGRQLTCEPEPVTINVSKVILPDRVATGCGDLDNLLLGGIPEKCSVLLTSPSCDERSLLIRRFLEVGARRGEITFCVTVDASNIAALAEECQSNFYLFVCNPRADEIVKSLPNVFKLKGVENLTEISIGLASALRRLEALVNGPRRTCIEIISDVLLQHHAVATRRWLTSIIPELRSKGFTTLAVMNPQTHNPEEVQAILDVLDGEISIYEKETRKGSRKFVRIKKMYNQKYIESELPLKKERL
jgi:KaiC/GvpD/RAD55 family RecA-like ATPase